ncbi:MULTISPECIES: hypothetical protein [unclassified Pseudomonas]|uniref:GapS4b family protein n=1 Tax=unclassified Pseudomonas TaxID=196821 RepID=UPI001B320A35|nr:MULTISPECIES: hypothetical protein [unclassified Pseudomonas]
MTTHNLDSILPQGEALRTYLIQPYIAKGDLKNVLRNRGVFLSEQDKEQSIPALTLSLIKPSEFSELQQAYSTKEDNPKITTQTIKWQGQSSLIESIPDEINVNKILDLDFENFKVLGAPDFYPVDGNPDIIRMDFTIERLDRSKSWAEARKNFKSSIEIKKNIAQDELIIISTHTAPETKLTNKTISKHLINHFKTNKQIDNDEKIKLIRFKDFTNENRFGYLLGLTQYSRMPTVSFIEIVDIGLAPDIERTLPNDLDWMKDRIRSLDLKGISLEESEFLSNPAYRPSLYLHRLDAKFRFSTSGLDGECVISLGFPEFSAGQNKDSEIELRIKTITFENIQRGMDKNEAKEKILKELEHEKIETFKTLSIQPNQQ